MEVIKDVKRKLSSKFEIKYFDAANLILGMEIKRNRVDRKLRLNKKNCVETILLMFNMQECKPIKVPISVRVRIFAEKYPKTQEEEEGVSHVPYDNVVGILLYAMVCTRPDISHAVGVLRRYMSKP